jgi:DNA repair protein RadC
LDTPVTSADTLADYFIPRIGNNQSESFYVICLSSANRVINYKEVTKGILDSTTIHAREVFRVAIEHNAKSIIIMHNHPSGNTQPSEQDIELTKTLAQAGKIIGISVLDHLIITRGSYRSLFAMGYF